MVHVMLDGEGWLVHTSPHRVSGGGRSCWTEPGMARTHELAARFPQFEERTGVTLSALLVRLRQRIATTANQPTGAREVSLFHGRRYPSHSSGVPSVVASRPNRNPDRRVVAVMCTRTLRFTGHRYGGACSFPVSLGWRSERHAIVLSLIP